MKTRSVILQHRGTWSEIPTDHPRIEYLFDLSEGRGEEGFEHWPDPPEDRRVGYAGGLGPHNVTKALEFAKGHPKAKIWFDMERNVRDQDYHLDLDMVREVCRLALGPQRRLKSAPLGWRKRRPGGESNGKPPGWQKMAKFNHAERERKWTRSDEGTAPGEKPGSSEETSNGTGNGCWPGRRSAAPWQACTEEWPPQQPSAPDLPPTGGYT